MVFGAFPRLHSGPELAGAGDGLIGTIVNAWKTRVVDFSRLPLSNQLHPTAHMSWSNLGAATSSKTT